MYLTTKTMTQVEVFMNDADVPDTFIVEASEPVMFGWADLMAAWGQENKIAAIKHFRSHFGCGFAEAKAFVEDAMRHLN